MITATRYHDFSAGHRVLGHENKCAHLHGHNYRVHFTCTARLDPIGRVLDFGVMKEKLCDWLERRWDHKFILNEDDPWVPLLQEIDPEGVVTVPFNPTAENMAWYLCQVVAPSLLKGTGVVMQGVVVEETTKCKAEYAWTR